MTLIGSVIISGKLVLAPMAGVSDLAFRTVCREHGAALAYSEMISAKALMYQDKKTRELLLVSEADKPLAVQIFGSEPDVMAEAAQKAREISNCDIVDINMGCPTGKIVKNNEGAALMRNPELAGRIIESVVKASNVPVSVKIRKGWDNGNVCAVEYAKIAEQAGASAIAVHGRTRAQLYSGTADWGIISEVKQAVHIPVIANGDVFEPQDAVRILRQTGADLIMIGRGSMGNPWIFEGINALFDGVEAPLQLDIHRRCDVAMRQFDLAEQYKGERLACLEARKHYAWYLRGVPYAGHFKRKMAQICDMKGLREITEGIKRELR